MKKTSKKELQKQVDQFNSTYGIGCRVYLKQGDGKVIPVTIKSQASILGGHTAVAWFNEVASCYSIDSVNPPHP